MISDFSSYHDNASLSFWGIDRHPAILSDHISWSLIDYDEQLIMTDWLQCYGFQIIISDI